MGNKLYVIVALLCIVIILQIFVIIQFTGKTSEQSNINPEKYRPVCLERYWRSHQKLRKLVYL